MTRRHFLLEMVFGGDTCMYQALLQFFSSSSTIARVCLSHTQSSKGVLPAAGVEDIAALIVHLRTGVSRLRLGRFFGFRAAGEMLEIGWRAAHQKPEPKRLRGSREMQQTPKRSHLQRLQEETELYQLCPTKMGCGAAAERLESG